MRKVVGGLTALAVCCLGLAMLAAPSQATGQPKPRPRLSSAQAATMRTRIRNGTAASSAAVLDYCHTNNLHCQAQLLSDKSGSTPLSSTTPIGYGATDLQAAYGISGASSTTGTIAIVDAGAYPTAGSDLSVYRRQYGLPACTKASGCLTVRTFDNKAELKPATTKRGSKIEEEIAVETALDLDMASAACPSCKLLLLQVPPEDGVAGSTKKLHTAEDDFATAVQTAKGLGAKAVSISYGYPTDTFDATGAPAVKMNLTGVTVTASTGDSGYNGLYPPWPQVLPSVVAVGGTELSQASNGAWHDAVWDGGGSGCSAGLTAPAYGQPSSISDLCNGSRASADLSAVADPETGVAVYDTYAPATNEPYAWIVVGGTSASSPLVAGMAVRAGVPASVHGPNRIYAKPASVFRDVVAGGNAPRGVCSADGVSERLCFADNGWDGPTGRGVPTGLAAFN